MEVDNDKGVNDKGVGTVKHACGCQHYPERGACDLRDITKGRVLDF